MRVFVLNLDNRTDRWETVTRELKDASFPLQDVVKVSAVRDDKTPSYGCFQSFRKAFCFNNNQEQEDDDAIIVFEDDVCFPIEPKDKTYQIIDRLYYHKQQHQEIDLILLGCSSLRMKSGGELPIIIDVENGIRLIRVHTFTGLQGAL